MSAGGKRLGAGRPKGSRDKATAAQGSVLSELARQYTEVAIMTLVEICQKSDSDAARVSAAAHLLDRGYGKAPQGLEHKGEMIIVLSETDARL
jgi:hypothetical protein